MEKKEIFKNLKKRLRLEPCPIGKQGFCCKNCLMGPCKILDGKGICGASRDLVVARNLLRFVAGGAASHCGHSLHLLHYLKKRFPENYIKKKAPSYLYRLWKGLNMLPEMHLEHFKEISEALHVTTLGVNSDWRDILKWCIKIGIIDGYYGMYLATELEDQTFGKPEIKKAKIDLGCIGEKKANIAIHGHEPFLAEAIVKEAKKHKVNLVGVCCTGASLLAKHGIPLASHFSLQEEVISTGMIEVMAVDLQCIMPSLSDLVECYHTKLITTAPIAKMPNSLHMPITNRKEAKEVAKKIIEIAIKNKKNRNKKLIKKWKKEKNEVVVGFSEDSIGIESIVEKIERKEIKGVVGVIGCVNPRAKEDWVEIFKKLSKEYIIFTTGCMAFEFGKKNLLDGKRFFHLGSCINNARIAEIFKRIADALGKEITDLPFLISCPRPITEKAIAIGFFFASLGVDVHFGYPFLLSSETKIAKYLESTLKKDFQSKIFLETDPKKFYKKIKKDELAYTFPNRFK